MGRYKGYSKKQMQDIANRYIASGQPWPAAARQIAAWAIAQELWAPQPSSLVDECAEWLARAMGEEYFIDPQGRTVRAKYAARVEEGILWADLRTASRTHMEIAFQQRRQQVLGDCRQLKVDVDSYNDNTNPGAPIQMTFDFTFDLELEGLIK